MSKKILLVTRPIAPPWDEASKNFAFNLATNTPQFEFGLLTNGKLDCLPPNVTQHPIYTSNQNDFFQKFRLLRRLKKLSREYDIVHFLFTPTKINSFWLKHILYSKKSIQTVATLREDLYADSDLKKMLFADKIITYSNHAAKKLAALGFSNVKQIYPGIDLNLYRRMDKDSHLLAELRLRNNDFVVTYPGEFSRLGATDDIIKLITRNAQTFLLNNIRFVFACRIKNEDDQRKKTIIENKLNDSGNLQLVRFPTTFTTLEKMLNASDVILFPVRDMKGKFDVPLAVIEAMACEKPVIISQLPILREFSDNQNSVIIKSGDLEEIMNAIMNLKNDDNQRIQIGKNAGKFVELNFSINKCSAEYQKVYSDL